MYSQLDAEKRIEEEGKEVKEAATTELSELIDGIQLQLTQLETRVAHLRALLDLE